MPLESTQELLNGSQDTASIKISAVQGDAGLLRISAIPGFGYNNISTSAQTGVKLSAGVLGGVILNTTLVSAVRIYDNIVSGGNVIATIPAGQAAGTFYEYGVKFANGLVVSSGAAADNLTILYL